MGPLSQDVKLKFLYVFILNIIILQICEIRCANADQRNNTSQTFLEKLRHDLFNGYDRHVKPAESGDTITMGVSLDISHVELDSATAIFIVYGRMHSNWKDPKLVWNKDDYGGLDFLPILDHEIWIPDLLLYNTISKNSADYYGNSQCHIWSNGNVSWIPYVKFQSLCNVSPELWPFDSHTCTLVLGSWTYDATQIDLKITGESTVMAEVKNNIWNIEKVESIKESKLYPCCEEAYVSIKFDITIQRRSSMYKTIVFTPTVCIVLMTLATFWLPPQRGEKIILNGVNLLIVVMFLRYFADYIPVFSQSTPLIVKFYSNTLVFISFSMLISVLVLYLAKTKHARQLPPRIKTLLKGCIGKTLGVGNLNPEAEQTELKETTEGQKSTEKSVHFSPSVEQGDWIALATAVDRISFLVYCLAFFIVVACGLL